MVKGDTIEFENDIPINHNAKNSSFSPEEEVEIQVILEEILHKKIIRENTHEVTEFFSPIFIVKKSDGGTRLILTLKELNEFVRYEHFKMNGIKTVINIVTRKCFMDTIDLKDAYYCVACYFRNSLTLNGKINCTVLHVFQMVLVLTEKNSLNYIKYQLQLYILKMYP